jgi:S-(hydroxymethyl)glutathione dehydrogenase/alcohol dehydrogenase
LLGCAIPTGGGIINNTLQAQAGKSIIVFGVGGVGLSAILAAKLRKCHPIIAVDVFETKLRFAKKLGATHAVNAKSRRAFEQMRRIVPQGLDYAIDASGSKAAMESAFEVLNTKGILVIAGNLAKGETISLHPFELIKGKRIVGTWGGETLPDKDFPKYARDFLQGHLPIRQLITHRFSLEEVNRAFDVLKQGQAGRIVMQCAPNAKNK